MYLIATAMKEIEWVDSGDASPPSDTDAIKAVFGDLSSQKELEVLVEAAREIMVKISVCIQNI